MRADLLRRKRQEDKQIYVAEEEFTNWIGNYQHQAADEKFSKSRKVETYEVDENTLVIKHFGMGNEEILSKLQQILQEAQHFKLSSPIKKVKPKITNINSDLWIEIYKFAGVENVVANQIYMLSKEMMSILYNDQSFWVSMLKTIWKGEFTQLDDDFERIRSYCIFKSQCFLQQDTSRISLGNVGNRFYFLDMNSLPMASDSVSDPCFLKTALEKDAFFINTAHQQYSSKLDLVFDIFLNENLSCVSLHIKTENRERKQELSMEAKYQGKIIPIVHPEKTVKMGIKRLVQALNISESGIRGDYMPHRFLDLEIGELKYDKYFMWFCNSILQHVSIPIEKILGMNNYMYHRNFGVDDETNEKIEEWFYLRRYLGIEQN